MPNEKERVTISFEKLKVCLSINEAVEATGLCRPTIEELIRRKELPAFRVNKRIVIPVKGLFEWADRRASEGATL